LAAVAELVLGLDAGGTHTRALAVTLDGEIAGRGAASGANIRSSGGNPKERFAAALTAALGGLDPAEVSAGVFGVAGAGAAGAGVVRAAADMAWWSLGLGGRPRVVTDLEVAFVSGTPEPDGMLLLAGTGAASAALKGRRIVRRCDGYGWLLGDEGSAVWLGLRGVRAALDAQDGRGAPTRLHADLAGHFGLDHDADLAQPLIARLHAADPAHLGALAPLVTRAATAGDQVALDLVGAAADRLVAGVHAVAGGRPAGELVLAGALLAAGPVRSAVMGRLSGAPLRIRDAGPGAAGAAALAIATVRGGLPADLHTRLVTATV
jgi:N-acetylglucosamine kinase-like BadF-type ATPase